MVDHPPARTTSMISAEVATFVVHRSLPHVATRTTFKSSEVYCTRSGRCLRSPSIKKAIQQPVQENRREIPPELPPVGRVHIQLSSGQFRNLQYHESILVLDRYARDVLTGGSPLRKVRREITRAAKATARQHLDSLTNTGAPIHVTQPWHMIRVQH